MMASIEEEIKTGDVGRDEVDGIRIDVRKVEAYL